MVITRGLRQFFPVLDEAQTSSERPTVDRSLRAEMFVGMNQVADGLVRYQFQTWGGTRPAESRITDGFRPLHRRARGGDILVFQRSANDVDRFRLILIKRRTPAFTEIRTMTGDRDQGPLFLDNEPVTQAELNLAASALQADVQRTFVVSSARTRVESRQSRIARSSIFPVIVRREYDWRCCVSGVRLQTPSRIHEVEAAHVVPVTEGGPDDVRNGISLSRTLHWAFDRGLFGIRPNRTVYVPRSVRRMSENSFLNEFRGQTISEAQTTGLRVHDDALAWHRENRVKQWE